MSFKYTPGVLKKLEQLFEEAGFKLRYEKGSFASGYCLLEARRVAVVNRFLNIEGRINALLEILPSVLVDENALSGEILRFYQQTQLKHSGAPEAETQSQRSIALS